MTIKFPTAIDKKMENQLLDFSSSLSQRMAVEDIVTLYEQLEKEHWLAEAKLIVMRLLFQSTLNEQFAKDTETQEETQLPMFA